MSWQTVDPRTGVIRPAASGLATNQALSLLEAMGRQGWSCLASYDTEAWSPIPSGGSNSGPFVWLKQEGLAEEIVLPWRTDQEVPIVRLTATGKEALHKLNKPVVRSEIEILQDRCGHSLKPHYGQCILFAALARRVGYKTRLCVTLPTQTTVADVQLERQDDQVWVTIESGLDRSMHPLDRWHRMAQIQAYLPLVAPTLEKQQEIEKQAKERIYVMRSTSLTYLLAQTLHRNTSLWNRRYNRFEEQTAKRFRPRNKPGMEIWAAGHGAMLRALTQTQAN